MFSIIVPPIIVIFLVGTFYKSGNGDGAFWTLILGTAIGVGIFVLRMYGLWKNQVLQVWDGFGFGELEYHSVTAGAGLAACEINDTSCLYGFRGQPERIVDIASELLDLSRQTIVDLLPDNWFPRR